MLALAPANGRLRWSGAVNGRIYGTPAVAGGRSSSVVDRRLADRVLDRGPLPVGVVDRLLRLLVAGRLGRTRLLRLVQRLLYCVSARTGATIWTPNAGGPISGAADIVDGIVYAGSTRADHRRRRAHRPELLPFPHGEYVPVSGNGGGCSCTASRACTRSSPKSTGVMKSPDRAGRARCSWLGAGAGYVLLLNAPGTRHPRVVHRGVRHHRGAVKPVKPPKPGIDWPMYGYDEQRTHVAASNLTAAVPAVWFVPRAHLVEFPPAIGYGRLYFTNNYGQLYAVRREDRQARLEEGFRALRRELACGLGHLVYPDVPGKRPCNRGKPKGLTASWSRASRASARCAGRRASAPSETSPSSSTASSTSGDWNGRMYALDRPPATQVVVQDERQDQGRRRGLGQPRLRRLVRPPLYALNARDRQAALAGVRPAAARHRGEVLLDACGRVRPRLHRRHGRQGVLVRRDDRKAALVARRQAATCTRRLRSGASASTVGSYSR